MQRCIDLALKGAGQVSPNPMVGALLVYNNRIIGEGWHKQYGQAHAEVNCIASVSDHDHELVSKSTLYVSLEPCAHYGKTPPCADLIIQNNIPEVIIGCTDSYKEVSGKGIQKLKAAGVAVTSGILEKECRWLNRRFFTRQEFHRPYIILKWAESDGAFIAPEKGKRFMLSNIFSQKMVQKMRSEEDAILVGYNTALQDNPQLNNRYGSGKQPLRIVIDQELKLPHELRLFDQSQRTIIFNYLKSGEEDNILWMQLNRDRSLAQQVIEQLKDINSIIIEGGSKTLQAFIDEDLWDEALVFRTPHILLKGTKAPQLKNNIKADQFPLQDDIINMYHHEHTQQLYRNQ